MLAHQPLADRQAALRSREHDDGVRAHSPVVVPNDEEQDGRDHVRGDERQQDPPDQSGNSGNSR